MKSLEDLEKVFNEAKENKCCICVEVTIPGQDDTELIINKYESLDNKLNYYKNTYNENLIHKKCNDIKIVGATALDFVIQRD